MSSSEITDNVFVLFEIVTLVIFSALNIKYLRVFKTKVDPLTVVCMVLVLLTVLIKGVLRVVYNILHEILLTCNYDDPFVTWWGDNNVGITCMNFTSNLLPNCLLTFALLINSARWLIVLIYLLEEETTSSFNDYVSSSHLIWEKTKHRSIVTWIKVIMASFCIIIFIITIVQLNTQCSTSLESNKKSILFFYTICLLILNFVPLSVYIVVGILMYRYMKRLHKQHTLNQEFSNAKIIQKQIRLTMIFFAAMIFVTVFR